MKKIFLILFIIGINSYSQTIIKEQFIFDGVLIDYDYTFFKNSNRSDFYIIINSNESNDKFIKCIKNRKKSKSTFFFTKIPTVFNTQEIRERLIFEFIRNVLRRKFVDYKMNIISDFDYFNLYNDNRNINIEKRGNYLNKINSLTLFNAGESACVKVK